MNPRTICLESISSLLVLLVLAGSAATAGAAEATRRPASIVIFGDSGYIPSYEKGWGEHGGDGSCEAVASDGIALHWESLGWASVQRTRAGRVNAASAR